MKLKFVEGNSLIFESTITEQDFADVSRFEPDKLKLKDRNGETYFVMNYTKGVATGCVTDKSIAFNTVRGGNLAAIVPVTNMGEAVSEEQTKRMLASQYAGVIKNAEIVEEKVGSVKESIARTREEMMHNIEII